MFNWNRWLKSIFNIVQTIWFSVDVIVIVVVIVR